MFESLGLTDEKTERIVFNEITKSAILRAVENPRKINKELVDAQQARRVLDRLVGYELSPVLWKSIQRGLSAGRVQSVAVRLIVEKEREIEAHVPASSFKVSGVCTDEKISFKAEVSKNLQEEEARQFLEQCVGTQYKVESVEKRPGKRSPAAPFTTSTLQQEASRKLGYSVSQTMTLAQRLYEAGHITYMRTDSFNLSNLRSQELLHTWSLNMDKITTKRGSLIQKAKEHKKLMRLLDQRILERQLPVQMTVRRNCTS